MSATIALQHGNKTPYSTDLNASEWQILEPLIPAAKPGGRPEVYPKREIVNAILYVLRTGWAWRLVPHDLPPWGIVYHYFWHWRRDGTWKRIHDTFRGDLRVLEGARKTGEWCQVLQCHILGLTFQWS